MKRINVMRSRPGKELVGRSPRPAPASSAATASLPSQQVDVVRRRALDRMAALGRSPARLTLVAALIVALSALLSLVLGLTRPVLYAAEIDVVMTPDPSFSDAAVQRMLVTEQILMTSPGVVGPVASEFGLTTQGLQDRLSTDVVRQESFVLRLTAVAGERSTAAEIARTVLQQYEPVATDYGVAAPVSRRSIGPYALAGRVQPRPMRDLALGVFAGLLLAAGTVFLTAKYAARRSASTLWPVRTDQPRQDLPGRAQ